MDWSEQESSEPVLGKDWEKALSHYENVVACGNEALQIKATIKLAGHVNRAPVHVLARCIPVLAELLRSRCTGSSPSIQEAAVLCLKRFARLREGNLAEIIGQSGIIPSLLNLLPHSGGHFLVVLLKCLRNIVIASDTSRLVLAENGGLEIILGMLASDSHDGLRRLLLETLSALSLVREVRRAMLGNGGIRYLVESASTGGIAARSRAAQAIGLLGLVRRARRMLVDSGAIQVLIELFHVGGTPTKLVVANALGVISSHVDYIRPVAQAGAIPLFVELMEGPEPMGKEIAEDVFSILGVNEASAITIVGHLVRILGGGDDAAKAAAANVLWNLAGYEHSSAVVQSSGAIPVLVRLLSDGNVDVREKVSGAVSQLSYNDADRVALTDAGAIPLLLQMLGDESQEVRDNAAEALVTFSEDRLLRDRVSEAFGVPAFQNMQLTVSQIRRSGVQHHIRSLGQMSID